MPAIFARSALLPTGWQNDVLVMLSACGRIASVTTQVSARAAAGEDLCQVEVLIPAPVNCHSHAFQRAMAGLTERRGPTGRDSFWTWRQLMFRFLETLTPDQVEEIAAFAQMEMLEAGFAAVVEFHYLHHQPDGTPYADPAEMCWRIIAAARESGIGLTLLPTAYRFGGCDRRALGPGQRRFGTEPSSFTRLLESAERALGKAEPDTVLGVAAHSLRAVPPEDFPILATLRPTAPIHMHLAETIGEVEEVQSSFGAHPVDWALAHLPLSPRWCLIHLTQMRPDQVLPLARTGAIAGLCPLTEASLGDGIFDAVRWLDAEGGIAVGSDSNIRISLAEEIRQLETTQRLRDHSRAALATAESSTGRRILEAMLAGGARAAGRESGRIAPGAWADLLALDAAHPDLEGLSGDTMLDVFAFAGDSRMVREVWAAGRHLVRKGCHIRREMICARYRAAVAALRQPLL